VSVGESENEEADFVVEVVVSDFLRVNGDRRGNHRMRGNGGVVAVVEIQNYLFDHDLSHGLVAGT
jgi:hypothetical protein